MTNIIWLGEEGLAALFTLLSLLSLHNIKVLFDRTLTDAAEGAAALRVRRHGGQDAVSGACRGGKAALVGRRANPGASGAVAVAIICRIVSRVEACVAHVTRGEAFFGCRNNKWGLSPQPEMIGRWLVISGTGGLNTDRPGPQRGCGLRASLFISSDNITQRAPVKAPFFYSLQ